MRGRDEIQDRVDHAQAGAQDRHQAELDADLLAGQRRQRRLDLQRVERQIERGLVQQKLRQLAHQLAELLRLGDCAAQQRQLMLHQRVLRNLHMWHWASLPSMRSASYYSRFNHPCR